MSTVDPNKHYGRCDSLDESSRSYCREYIDRCVAQRATRGARDSTYELVSENGKSSTGLKFIDCIQLSPIYALHGKPKAAGSPVEDKKPLPNLDRLSSNDACYREGMLIFQSLPDTSRLVEVIQDATDSPITHVGILHKNDDGDWVVIESFGNYGRETPVDEFLKRSNGIAWFKVIDGIDAKRFIAEASKLTKTYPEYDSSFKYDNGKLYCSELIALAAKAVGVDLFDVDVRASWLDQTDESVAKYLQSSRSDRPDMEKWRILPPNTLFHSNKLVDPTCAADTGNNQPTDKIPNHALYDNLPGKTTSEKMKYLKSMWGNYVNQATVKKETVNGYTHYFFKWSANGVEHGLILFGQFPEEESLAQEILK